MVFRFVRIRLKTVIFLINATEPLTISGEHYFEDLQQN